MMKKALKIALLVGAGLFSIGVVIGVVSAIATVIRHRNEPVVVVAGNPPITNELAPPDPTTPPPVAEETAPPDPTNPPPADEETAPPAPANPPPVAEETAPPVPTTNGRVNVTSNHPIQGMTTVTNPETATIAATTDGLSISGPSLVRLDQPQLPPGSQAPDNAIPVAELADGICAVHVDRRGEDTRYILVTDESGHSFLRMEGRARTELVPCRRQPATGTATQ